MPLGIIIMEWNTRSGAELLFQYPTTVDLDKKVMIQIYSQHEYTGEAGSICSKLGDLNIISYYSGSENCIYSILLLQEFENGEIYEEVLADFTRTILRELQNSEFEFLLPKLFQKISDFPNFNEEQKLGQIFLNLVSYRILNRLREQGAIIKSELAIWLNDQFGDEFIDFDFEINKLVKNNLIKSVSVAGVASDILFLVQDILILRRPPIALFRNSKINLIPRGVKSKYLKEIRHFFSNYSPDNKENLTLLSKFISNMAGYTILQHLRKEPLKESDILRMKEEGVENIHQLLDDFCKYHIAQAFFDHSDKRYYCLLSDIYIGKFFPEYQIDVILREYKNKEQNPQVLLKELDLLEDEFKIILSQQKS